MEREHLVDRVAKHRQVDFVFGEDNIKDIFI